MVRVAAFVTLIAVLLGATVLAWFDEHNRPAFVRQRLFAAVAERHPGATGLETAAGWARINLPSGTLVDVALDDAYARCAPLGSHCGAMINALANDIDATQAASANPNAAALEAVVVADAANSARFGYVSRPLFGALEVRYAFVHGAALAFVTSAQADAMQASRSRLAQIALVNLQKRAAPRVAAAGDGVFRVDDQGDAAANLLDPVRMKAIADQIGASDLTCGIPSRSRLLVSGPAPAARAALAASLMSGSHTSSGDPARTGAFACGIANDGVNGG